MNFKIVSTKNIVAEPDSVLENIMFMRGIDKLEQGKEYELDTDFIVYLLLAKAPISLGNQSHKTFSKNKG